MANAQDNQPSPNISAAEVSPSRARAIIVGYGPVGRCNCDQLRREGYDVAIVETNLDTIERQLMLDKRVVYGDACEPQTLHHAGIAQAAALIVTIPSIDVAVEICKTARAMNADIYIAVRARHPSSAMLVLQAGADDVTIEEIVTARAMADQVAEHLRRR